MLLLAYINQIYPYYLPGNANVALFTVFFFHLGYIYRQKYLNIHPRIYFIYNNNHANYSKLHIPTNKIRVENY